MSNELKYNGLRNTHPEFQYTRKGFSLSGVLSIIKNLKIR